MLLLISDANIIIDLEAGEILEHLFQLPYQFAMPDVLFEEEVGGGSPYLIEMGLKTFVVMLVDILPGMNAGDSYGAQAGYGALPGSLRWVPAADGFIAPFTSQAEPVDFPDIRFPDNVRECPWQKPLLFSWFSWQLIFNAHSKERSQDEKRHAGKPRSELQEPHSRLTRQWTVTES